MHVLLIGSGGREHAIANALIKSKLLSKLYCITGNPGTEDIATNFNIPIENHREILNFCRTMLINFVIIGPEQPLAAGLTDYLENERIKVFGPSQAATMLESSKKFCKEFCKENNIPTAEYATFTDLETAIEYVQLKGSPIVVKNDALAAGKGVTVANTVEEAEEALRNLFSSRATVVVEEMLEGEEVSFFAICDGNKAIPIGTAQDHKRVGDGETGPNTGGMGAYSPASVVDAATTLTIMQEIVNPTIKGMAERGTPFKGILYAGLMLTSTGPKLIEYNTRFGDPEAQVILPRLEDDLLALMIAAADGNLPDKVLSWSNQKALTVVLAAKNYPGTPVTGSVIEGIDTASRIKNVIVTHAGTEMQKGNVIASGGRVLNVTALADTIANAQKLAYKAVDAITWEDGFCRKDIGWREIARTTEISKPKNVAVVENKIEEKPIAKPVTEPEVVKKVPPVRKKVDKTIK